MTLTTLIRHLSPERFSAIQRLLLDEGLIVTDRIKWGEVFRITPAGLKAVTDGSLHLTASIALPSKRRTGAYAEVFKKKLYIYLYYLAPHSSALQFASLLPTDATRASAATLCVFLFPASSYLLLHSFDALSDYRKQQAGLSGMSPYLLLPNSLLRLLTAKRPTV